MTLPFLYSVEREFAVPVERLWSAWTDAAELESWYFPVGLGSLKGGTISDLKIDGVWASAVEVAAHNFTAYFYGKYTNIVDQELIEHTMHYTESKVEFELKYMYGPAHNVVLNFEVRESGSWVKFSQFGELPAGEEKRAQAGMESYLDSLEGHLGLRQN